MPAEESRPAGSDAPRFVRRKVLAVVPRLCPSCLAGLQRVGELGGWLTPQNYYCPKCGYNGYAYLETDPEKRTN